MLTLICEGEKWLKQNKITLFALVLLVKRIATWLRVTMKRDICSSEQRHRIKSFIARVLLSPKQKTDCKSIKKKNAT